MNLDIRLSLDFFVHPKTVKLQRACGIEGVHCLLRLWCWAANYRPKGNLDGVDPEDIEIAVNWNGNDGEFVSALIKYGFLEQTENGYCLHDWLEHQGYASKSEERHEIAQKAAQARWEKEHKKTGSYNSNSNCNAQSNADSNADSNAYSNAQSNADSMPQNTKIPRYKDINNNILKQEREPQKSSVEKQASSRLQEYSAFAAEYQNRVLEEQPGIAPKVTDALIRQGAQEIDKAIRLDGLDFAEIKAALEWARQDSFWSPNVLSLAQIRRKGGNGISKLQTIVGQYRKAKQQRASPAPSRDSPRYESRYEREQREMRESYQETMRILGMMNDNEQGNSDEQKRANIINAGSF